MKSHATTALLALSAASASLPAATMADTVDPAAVVRSYADIGAAVFADSATMARRLEGAVDALIAAPSGDTMRAARAAWIAARVPFEQAEVFRVGNPIVDAWEGKVNSWPLDEGLIDYVETSSYNVAPDSNPLGALNVIATPRFTLDGADVDASEITPALLSNYLEGAADVPENVATGYHAIEFLLWGQDLHGTGHGAGERPWTDYAAGDACTHGNCDRRGAYLKAATELLVSDLDWMETQWSPDGDARQVLLGDPHRGLAAMLAGMGSLSYGELAGERMKLGVLLHDPEEEQDCFSDNTPNALFYNGLGIRNILAGEYVGVDGRIVRGPSLAALLAETDPDLQRQLGMAVERSMARLTAIRTVSETGMRYDMMLARDNARGEALIMAAVDALIRQAGVIQQAKTTLKLDDVALGDAKMPQGVGDGAPGNSGEIFK